ncbi:MAG: hypothetical protein Q3995_06950 [Eubacteriales bacterium]|nr:hypothetical protein [Eubacteriales bacterium]
MDNEMTVQQEILAIAAELSRAQESEQGVLEKLCMAAYASVEERLREGVCVADCAAAFTCACAWLAAGELIASRKGGEELSSLRAGDLSVTRRSDGERAAACVRLSRQAWELMAPYIRDSGFCFRGVRA